MDTHSFGFPDSITLGMFYFDWALPNRCHSNVQRAVEEHGGRLVTGWLTRNYFGVLAELCHHAAWERPEGDIVEITPRLEGISEGMALSILAPQDFLPDPHATFPAVGSLHNRYIPLIAVPELYEACSLLRKADRLVYDEGDWSKAEQLNKKANRILHRHGVDCPLPPREMVACVIRPEKPKPTGLDRAEKRRRKKLERQRKKQGRRR